MRFQPRRRPLGSMLSGAALVLLAASPSRAFLPTPDHVVVVVLENRSYDAVIGSGAAPYLDGLAASGAVFTDSHGVTHPSQPNYLWLFSGSDQGVTDNSCPVSSSADNLGQGLIDNGWSFAVYSEDLPAEGSTVCTSGKYARKHNPAPDFTNVPASANKPFTAFPADFAALPTVSWVIPNLDHDMHDGTIGAGDSWVAANLDPYLQWAQLHNSLLVVTFDENDGTAGNRIATIFAGPMVLPGSYAETIDHLNVLRTVEDMYGIPYAGASAAAAPIADSWNFCGDGTANAGEECGEPGLSCGVDLTCQGCSCVNTSICASGIAPDTLTMTMAADPFSLALKATAVLPKPWTAVDPVANGIRVVVDGLSGASGIDATLPGGGAWTVNAAGTRWRYSDRTASIAGIVRAVVSDRSSKQDGLLKVTVKGKGGSAVTLPTTFEARVAVVFGAPGECAASGFASAGAPCTGDATRIRCR